MDSFDVKPQIQKMLVDALAADVSLPSNLTVVDSLSQSAAVFPRVVFQSLPFFTKQRTLNYEDYTKTLTFQVDIFCKEPAAEAMIARISKTVNTVLEKTLHLEQTGGNCLETGDLTSKRLTLTYRGDFNENDGCFH